MERTIKDQEQIYTFYQEKLAKKFDSLGLVQREIVLRDLELLLERVLKIREYPLEVVEASFSYKQAVNIRKLKGISQRALAKELDIPQSTISRFETGKVVPTKRCKDSTKYLNWLNSY